MGDELRAVDGGAGPGRERTLGHDAGADELDLQAHLSGAEAVHLVGGIAAAMAHVHLPLLMGWDGYRYAFLVSGAALVAGGLAAKSGAAEIEAETREVRS